MGKNVAKPRSLTFNSVKSGEKPFRPTLLVELPARLQVRFWEMPGQISKRSFFRFSPDSPTVVGSAFVCFCNERTETQQLANGGSASNAGTLHLRRGVCFASQELSFATSRSKDRSWPHPEEDAGTDQSLSKSLTHQSVVNTDRSEASDPDCVCSC